MGPPERSRQRSERAEGRAARSLRGRELRGERGLGCTGTVDVEAKDGTARGPAEAVPASVRADAPPRPPVADPALGAPVVGPCEPARHPFVVIGDSIWQGMQSGGLSKTEWSPAAIVARHAGVELRHARFDEGGGTGIPLDLERAVRELERRYGAEIGPTELPRALAALRSTMAESERHWEGVGRRLRTRALDGPIHHNLAVYGWDVRDVMTLTADTERARLVKARNNLVLQVPEGANEIVAISVLDTARDESGRALTPVGAARALGDDGCIDTLIVGVGANNALRAMIELKVVWSQDDGYTDRDRKQTYTVWDPVHFEAEYRRLATELKAIRANRVVLTTVPHVTIAPIGHGVGGFESDDSPYYRYYTRPWVPAADFDPRRHDQITGAEARAVDAAIDRYNEAIVEIAREARAEGRDWLVLDAAAILDRLAVRRYRDEARRPDWHEPYPLPPELDALEPRPDVRFWRSGPEGRTQGGLFSLDATHPDTIGYGILAQELVHLLADAGVAFPNGLRIDFGPLIEASLVHDPPTNFDQAFAMLATALKFWERLSPSLTDAAAPTRTMTGLDRSTLD